MMNGVLLGQGGQPLAPPVVSICIPSQDTMMVKTTMCLLELLLHVQTHNYCKAHFINAQSSSIAHNRNQLAGASLEMARADYAFFIDTDMMFPPNVLERLLKSRRRVVGCTYPRRTPPHEPLGRLKPPFNSVAGIQPADFVPGGMLLVKTDVFKQVPFPWFFESWVDANPPMVSEDYNFCIKAREHGVELFLDLDLSRQIAHLGVQGVIVPPHRGAFPPPPAEQEAANANEQAGQG